VVERRTAVVVQRDRFPPCIARALEAAHAFTEALPGLRPFTGLRRDGSEILERDGADARVGTRSLHDLPEQLRGPREIATHQQRRRLGVQRLRELVGQAVRGRDLPRLAGECDGAIPVRAALQDDRLSSHRFGDRQRVL
jgi:hypothetical protein